MLLAFLMCFIQLTQHLAAFSYTTSLYHLKLKCPHHPVDSQFNKTALVGYETDLPTSVLQTAGHATSRNDLLNKRFLRLLKECLNFLR